MHILIIEGQGETGEAMRRAALSGGHEAHLARSGGEALTVAPALAPRLVFCDLDLKDMDGVEVCRALRRFRSCARPPSSRCAPTSRTPPISRPPRRASA